MWGGDEGEGVGGEWGARVRGGVAVGIAVRVAVRVRSDREGAHCQAHSPHRSPSHTHTHLALPPTHARWLRVGREGARGRHAETGAGSCRVCALHQAHAGAGGGGGGLGR